MRITQDTYNADLYKLGINSVYIFNYLYKFLIIIFLFSEPVKFAYLEDQLIAIGQMLF